MFYFYTPLKKTKNHWFSDVSRELRSGKLAWNGLIFVCFRGILRSLLNLYDGLFCEGSVQLKAINCFLKKFDDRGLAKS